MIGTLAVDGWAVTFGTARRGLGGLRPRPCSPFLAVPATVDEIYRIIRMLSTHSTTSPPINGHVYQLRKLFDVAL